MEKFNITNCVVQQAAETGGVQLLDGPELPTANDFLEEEVEEAIRIGLLPTDLSEEDIIKRAEKCAAAKALSAAKLTIAAALTDVYEISMGNSPFVPENPIIHCSPNLSEKKEFLDLTDPANISRLRFHQDRDNSLWGATVLWSLLPIRGEELVVAGRGFRPDASKLASYSYARGPILIVQKGFGELLVGSELAKYSAWHRGQRSKMGYLGLADVDFRAPLLRRQAIGVGTDAFSSEPNEIRDDCEVRV